MTVTSVNDAPVAVGDSYSTSEDTALSVSAALGVLGNDSDVDGGLLWSILDGGPTHGTLTLYLDGSFSYALLELFGQDSFTYHVSDGMASSGVATVTLSVSPVNDAPAAAGDSYSVNEDAALTVAAAGVLGNDSDVDSPTLSAVLESGTTHGTLTLNGDGSFITVPDADFFGTDSFTYRATTAA